MPARMLSLVGSVCVLSSTRTLRLGPTSAGNPCRIAEYNKISWYYLVGH